LGVCGFLCAIGSLKIIIVPRHPFSDCLNQVGLSAFLMALRRPARASIR
jgi:hypothetical protein